MKNEILQHTTEFSKAHQRKKRWQRLVTFLAAVVVFCTTYALILPAITMTDTDQILDCSFNIHEHTVDCYDSAHNLICGEADFVVHTHNSSCYDAGGNLVCELPEIEAHVHTTDCFRAERVLTCTLAEGQGHQHTADCYEIANVLICANPAVLHQHTDNCYDADGNLICGQIEVLEHVHGSGCFVEAAPGDTDRISTPYSGENRAEAYLGPVESTGSGVKKARARTLAETVSNADPNADSEGNPGTVPATKDPYDLANYITSVTIQRREKGDTLWQDIVGDNVKVDDELLFDLNYTIGAGKLDANHRVVTYQIDEAVKILEEDSGDVKDGSGAVVGSYLIGTDGKITITFNEDYAKGNAGGSPIIGHIAFESSVEAMGGQAGSEIPIPFKEGCTLHVKNTTGDLKVEKTSKNVVASDGTLDYEITVSSEHGTGEKVILEDIMTNVAMVEGTLTVKDQNGNDVEYTKLEDGRYELPQMNGGDKYILSYSAKTTSTPPTTSFIIATNTVNVSSTDSAKVPVTDDATTTDVFTKKLMVKSGVLSEDEKTISWTIRLNYDAAKISNTETQKADISGWTLKDVMDGQEYTGEVTIAPNPNTGSGTLTTHLPYTFPENSPKVEYDITYTTDGTKETSNTATLSPPKGGTGVDVTVQPGEFTVSKEGKGWSLLEARDADGNQLVKADWTVTVDATSCEIPADMTDWLPGRTKVSAWPYGGYWYLRERVYGSNYFTPEQLTEAAKNIAAAIEETSYSGGYYIFACVSAISNNDAADTILIKQGGQFQTGFELWDADNTYANGTHGRDINDGVNRNVIYVFFDSPLAQGESFAFDCSMTANVGAGSANTTIYNNVQLFTKSVKPEVTESQLFTPVIKKYDMYGGHTGTPGVPSEHTTGEVHEWYTYSNLSYSDVLAWKIQINFPEDKTYDEDIVITETLPDGIKLLAFDSVNSKTGVRAPNGTYGLYASFVTSSSNYAFKGTRCYFDGSGDHNYDSVTVDGTKIVNGHLNSPDANTCYETWGGYTVTYKKLSEQQYQIIVPKELANQLVGCQGSVIYVWAQLEDPTGWTGIEESFNNTVNIYTGKEKMGEASQEQTIKRNVIKKSSSGYDVEEEPNEIPYVLTINPEGADLVANSSTLTLTDELSFTPPDGSNINAMLDDITVINSKTGEDLTAQCPYTATGDTSEDGKVTRTFTMTIPDSTPLTVSYTYKMSGTGRVSDFKNTATVEGVGNESSSDDNTMEITVQKSVAEAQLVGVNVYKVDSKNYSLHLDGAKFKLEKWDGDEKDWVLVNSYETATAPDAGTDKNKQGTFNTGALTANTAYKLTETEAPPGENSKEYILNATPYYFYIVDTSENAPDDCMPDGFKDRSLYDVNSLNLGDHIMIENAAMGYELPDTGGAGTNLYAIGGLLLIAGAGSLLLYNDIKRRKEGVASS